MIAHSAPMRFPRGSHSCPCESHHPHVLSSRRGTIGPSLPTLRDSVAHGCSAISSTIARASCEQCLSWAVVSSTLSLEFRSRSLCQVRPSQRQPGEPILRASSYPFEKFFNAVDGMATSHSPLRDRVRSAFTSFIAVKAEDFADAETRTKFEALRESMRKVEDPQRGSIAATLEQMSDQEVEATADKIVEILHDLIQQG